jgi:type II secretory pathway pseudopilin PulG
MQYMNTKKTLHLSQKSSGFILVEVIVSIALLMLAVPAALTIASKSVFLASYSKDQVIATYLAQEGIEIIRNKRDENILGGLSWKQGFDSPSNCGFPQECRVDYGVGVPDPLIEKCTGSCTLVLSVDTASGVYAYKTGGTWVPTKFSRSVQTNDFSVNPNEIRITSTVTYMAGGVNKTLTMVDNLTSWAQ